MVTSHCPDVPIQPRKFDAEYWALQDQMDADEAEAHTRAWDLA